MNWLLYVILGLLVVLLVSAALLVIGTAARVLPAGRLPRKLALRK